MMKTHQQPPPPHRDESGQAALVVALFFFFVFLVFASLGVDGAAFYLTRRDLQSVADAAALAACTVLTQPQAVPDQNALAIEEAEKTITANYGSSAEFAGSDPPTTNFPSPNSGPNLLKGIEVSDPEVRVALQRDVPTVLTQFVGRASTTVTAQARCDSRVAGGVMPIAIQRYDGAPDGSLRDYIANKDASGYPPANPPWPYPSDSVTVTVDGRYGLFDVPWPKPEFLAKDGDLMDWQTGPEVSLVGQASETNNVAGSMSGFVMLDIRNVGSGNALEYYHGADGQANTMKDIGEMHINSGYQPPFPEVGSQVALLEGVSAAFAPQGMYDAGYRVDDVIAAIIYDGYVWTTPDFKITLTPRAANPDGITAGYPNDAPTAVTYDVNIARDGAANAAWFSPLNFDLTFRFSEPFASLPSGTNVVMTGPDNIPQTLTGPDHTFTVAGVQEALGWDGTLSIYSTSAGPTQTVSYLSGLNVIADSSSGSTRGAASNYGFGAPLAADYALSTSGGRLVVRQGGSATAYLTSFGNGLVINNQCKNRDAKAEVVSGGTALPWNLYFSSNPAFKVTIKQDNSDTASLSLNALDTAPTGSYDLRLTVVPASASCGPQRSLSIPLTILPPASNATPNKFVIVQGYAAFRISYMDANDVKGYAISRLYLDPHEIQYGLRPRLVPWS